MSTIEELEAQLASLRAEVQAMRTAAAPPPAPAGNRVLTRRNLLRAAPVAAVGAGIAALSAGTAAASPGDPLLIGENNDSGTAGTSLTGGSAAGYTLELDGPGLVTHGLIAGGLNITDEATILNAPPAGGGPGLQLNAPVEFGAETSLGLDGLDVLGQGPGTGIAVTWTDETSIHGLETHSPGAALSLTTHTCDLIELETVGGQVTLNVTGASTAIDAVDISYAGTKRALYAESTAATNINGTITGVNDGSGAGVWGENKNTTAAGIGVVGLGNAFGRGGRFAGGKANLQLTPSSAASHPSFTGHAGDLFVDATARLWYCKRTNTSSVPAVWTQLA